MCLIVQRRLKQLSHGALYWLTGASLGCLAIVDCMKGTSVLVCVLSGPGLLTLFYCAAPTDHFVVVKLDRAFLHICVCVCVIS